MASKTEPPRRGRFLWLRILFYVLSLPLVLWAVTSYGDRATNFAQSYPKLTGFGFWFWTVLFVWATWGVWSLMKRKWSRAKELSAELDATRRR
jgi:polyferredoxin